MQETLNHLGAQFISFALPMLWQSSLLIAVVFAADRVLARKLRASVRHALWLVVLAKLLLPPTLALPTSAAWWLFPAKPVVITSSLPLPKASNINTSVVIYDNVPPPDYLPEPAPQIEPRPKLNRAGWTLLATGALSVGLLFWLLLRWWQLTRRVRSATPAEAFPGLLNVLSTRWSDGLRHGSMVGILRRAAPEAGAPSVRVRIVDAPMSPAVCGLFRPVVLLPRVLAENLSAPQLRAVLLHELIHLRRRDIWVNCAQSLLQILYWWHPLVWFANARIRRVREEAVDDAVMLALAGEADTYAPTLLEVAKLAFYRPLMSLGIIGIVGIIESRSALRQRVERLLDFRAPRKAGLTLISFCGIFLFSAVALPMGQGPAQIIHAPQPAPVQTLPQATGAPVRPPVVLISAAVYQLPPQAFDKLVAGLDLHPADTNGDAWWSASPEEYAKLQGDLTNSHFIPISRPRLQTSSSSEADFFVGFSVGKNAYGTELRCTPKVNDEQIDLDLRGKITDHPAAPITNQFAIKASSPNHGGIVVRFPDDTNHTVVFLNVEIRPAPHSASSGILADPNFQTALHTLEQRTGAETLGEPEVTELPLRHENQAGIFPPRPPIQLSQTNTSSLPHPQKQAQFIAADPSRSAIAAKLDNIRLDNVSYDNLPLQEVLKQLSEQCRLRDPERKGINFLINNNPAQSSQPTPASDGTTPAPTIDPVTGLPVPLSSGTTAGNDRANVGSYHIKIPSQADVRLADVLDAIVLVSDHPLKYSIQDFGIVFSAKDTNSPQLFMRTFRVDPNTFYSGLENIDPQKLSSILETKVRIAGTNGQSYITAQSSSATTPSALARAFFTSLGVNLLDPPGKSVFFNDRLGVVFVKATKSDLDTIERALEVLNQTPPQIHINAQFLSVPKGALENLSNTLSAVTGHPVSLTGILTSKNADLVLEALEATKGAKALGKPAITVQSGRRAQMRVTQTQTVVTNMEFTDSHTDQNGKRISSSMEPQTCNLETGPVLDAAPYVLADDYTINLSGQDSETTFWGYADADKLPRTMVTNSLGAVLSPPAVLPVAERRHSPIQANLFDGQTLVLTLGEEQAEPIRFFAPDDHKDSAVAKFIQDTRQKQGDNDIIIFITSTIVDPTGARVHSDAKLSFAQTNVPPQPTATTDRAWLPPPAAGLDRINNHPQNLAFTGLGRKAIAAKLDRIRLDNVSYDNLPLSEVLKQLSQQSRLRDPERKGINFLINNNPAPSGQPTPASVGTTPAPTIDPATGLPVPPSSAPTATNNVTDIGSAIIKIPSLTDVRLADVLDAIVLVADRPLKYSIQDFAVVFSARGPETPQLFMRTFRVDPNTFYHGLENIDPQKLSDILGTKVRIAETNRQAYVTAQSSNAATPSALAKAFFTSLRVNLLDPPGKSVFFNDKRGLLFVKATEDDLDVIERALQAMSEPKDDESSVAQTARRIISNASATYPNTGNASATYPNTDPSFLTTAAREKERELMSQTLGAANSQPPAIHFKTRFISVPKGTIATIAKYLNATNQSGKPMGLLSANDNQALLKLLSATKGVETLGEPEVTMLSGRQSQVRATETVSVITHSGTNGQSAAVPQTNSVEVGPVLDLVPCALSDGYAINLAAIPSWAEFVNGNSKTQPLGQNRRFDDPSANSLPPPSNRQIISNVNLWDGQTLLLTGLSMDDKKTATTVDRHPGDAPHFGGSIDSKPGPEYLLIFITPTIVDEATGARIHSETDLIALPPLPPQPK